MQKEQKNNTTEIREEKEEQQFETVEPGVSTRELDRIRTEAHEKAKATRHTWRQKGFWIICKSCEFHHAAFVGSKNMIGEKEDGTPIFAILDKVS